MVKACSEQIQVQSALVVYPTGSGQTLQTRGIGWSMAKLISTDVDMALLVPDLT